MASPDSSAAPAQAAQAAPTPDFFCAYCLVQLAKPKTCSACKRRAYCSSTCQRADWPTHKPWCGLGCGEEGREWAVRRISVARGRGVVMLADVAAGFRVLVDQALAQDHPSLADGARRGAAMELVPEASADLAAKFQLNEYNSHEGPVIGLRLSRINHSCDPNAIKVADDGLGVNVVVALRALRAGEEVLLSYLPVDDCSVERDADTSRAVLAAKWGVRCPRDCRCRDAALAALMVRARSLDARVLELGRRCDVAGAVAAAEALLALYDEAGLPALHMSRARTLYDAFQVCVMDRAREAQAAGFVRRALAIHEAVYHPDSSEVVRYRELARSPRSHKNFGVSR